MPEKEATSQHLFSLDVVAAVCMQLCAHEATERRHSSASGTSTYRR